MLNKIKNIIRAQFCGAAESIAYVLIKGFRLDSRKIFFELNGILKYRDYESGEKWFIDRVLPRILSDIDQPVILDVGANIGKYSIALASALPTCRCYAFEPNPSVYKYLIQNTQLCPGVSCLNIGADVQRKQAVLYAKNNDLVDSELATLYPESLSVFRGYEQPAQIMAVFDSLDNLQMSGEIPSSGINFIKLDTEGHELQCLKGAANLLSDQSLRAIQFEFNDIHMLSRIFIKDFYDLLFPSFCFFRLDTNRLIYLGEYDTSNEIFKYQNIVVIRREYAGLVDSFVK